MIHPWKQLHTVTSSHMGTTTAWHHPPSPSGHVSFRGIRPGRDQLRDALSRRQRTCEGDHAHAWVEHEWLAAIPAIAADDVYHAGRKMGEEFGKEQGRERRHLRWLEDDGIACRQGRGNLPGHEQDGVVPGDDGGNDAIRLFEHQRELGLLYGRDDAPAAITPNLGIVVETSRGPAHLVPVLDEWFAALHGQ